MSNFWGAVHFDTTSSYFLSVIILENKSYEFSIINYPAKIRHPKGEVKYSGRFFRLFFFLFFNSSILFLSDTIFF